MSRRTKPEDVQHQRFRISLPTTGRKSRLGMPAKRDGPPASHRPWPLDTPVDRIGKRPDVSFGWRIAIEVHARSQHAGQRDGRVDRRKLAVPHATPGVQGQEMVEEAAAPRDLGLVALRRVPQELQRGPHPLRRVCSRDIPTLRPHDVAREREPRSSDACGGGRTGVVSYQPRMGIHFVQKVRKGAALELVQGGIIDAGPRVRSRTLTPVRNDHARPADGCAVSMATAASISPTGKASATLSLAAGRDMVNASSSAIALAVPRRRRGGRPGSAAA